MADDPVRQQIVEAIDARLKTILKKNGYFSDVGNNVFEWRESGIAAAELPALVYRDKVEEIEGFTMLEYDHRLVVDVDVVAEPGSVGVEEVRKIIADVFAAIGTDDRWGGLALDSWPIGTEIETAEDANVITGALVRFGVSYQTNKWGY